LTLKLRFGLPTLVAMMSDGEYRIDPDKVESALGEFTAHAIDVYRVSSDLNDMHQPSFGKAGGEIAEAFAYVRQRLAESLRATAQQTQQTNLTLSEGVRNYRNLDSETAREFRAIGGLSA
jgi:hypothetical protein